MPTGSRCGKWKTSRAWAAFGTYLPWYRESQSRCSWALRTGRPFSPAGPIRQTPFSSPTPGGVTDGHQHTQAVREALGTLLKDADARGDFRVHAVKQEILDQPFDIADTFLTFSMFVIVAGVMLVLNIYAMLAEERRTEMGVMRALGIRREHLVRLYLYEGLIYSLGPPSWA